MIKNNKKSANGDVKYIFCNFNIYIFLFKGDIQRFSQLCIKCQVNTFKTHFWQAANIQTALSPLNSLPGVMQLLINKGHLHNVVEY